EGAIPGRGRQEAGGPERAGGGRPDDGHRCGDYRCHLPPLLLLPGSAGPGQVRVVTMLGAIAGDIIGSVYEGRNVKTPHFQPLFHRLSHPTDDTVLTVAVADTILSGADYAQKMKEYFYYYPHAGYGGSFSRWAMSMSRRPYNSWGNGSAMRVSPVGFAYDSLEEVLYQAKRSAEVTHNHPEGVKGAQATAASVFLARSGKSMEEIREYVEQTFHYDLSS